MGFAGDVGFAGFAALADLAVFADFTGLVDFAFLGVSFTSNSMYLPPPPGPPGTYFRFLRGGPSLDVGSELREDLTDALDWFLDDLPGEEYFGEEYGAIFEDV